MMNKLIENNKYLQFTKLNEYDNLVHFYTKKPFSLTYEEYLQDKEKALTKLNTIAPIEIKTCILANQAHTTNVAKVTLDNLNDNFLNTDGLITNLKDVCLLTKTADCQAILLYDPINKVIGNIHSGWKGTLNKIIMKAINIMTNDYQSKPEDIIVCICPSILKCCFEVDYDVVESFKNNFSNIEEDIYLGEIKDNKQKYYIDTVNINKKVLLSLGLKEENIITSDLCTKCHHDLYHSYRYDQTEGRNIAAIILK